MAITALPEPMRVSHEMIRRARREVEGRQKKFVRTLLLPLLRGIYGFLELGEGFQWGLPLSIPRRAIRVGRFVYIGAHGSMSGPLVIGDFTMISTYVRIVGKDHRIDIVGGPTRLEFAGEQALTVIEADCWIGQGATLLEGITIGRGSVVAAGAVVTKSVPPYTVVGGVPAQLLRKRFDEDQVRTHETALFGGRDRAA